MQHAVHLKSVGALEIYMGVRKADDWHIPYINRLIKLCGKYGLPFLYTDDLPGTVRELKAGGIRLFAAHLEGRNNYEEEDYTGNTGFLIGNEGNGLTEELSAAADAWVKIPMAGKVESLNAAVAASILMFETARQRRSGRSMK